MMLNVGSPLKWNSTRNRKKKTNLLQDISGKLNLSPECCCFCSLTKSCLTLCDPMNYSTPGFFVLHYLPEFAQTHVHWVGDAIQPSHPLSPSSPPALNLSQLMGSFPMSQTLVSGGQSTRALALVLWMNIQSWFPLGLTGLISLLSKGLSRVLQHHNSKASIL